MALVAPPAIPVAAGKPDAWVAVERELGTRLPDDYKALVATYGWGMFDEFLFVMTPFSRPGETLVDFGAGSMLEGLRRSRAVGVDFPYPLHPEPGGSLPWGYTANGDWCYWLTEPPDEPDRWRIVINGSRSDHYWEHPEP